MTSEDAWAAVIDPRTEPAVLAEVAHRYPQFRPAIAAHVNAYPELRAWIDSVGFLPPAPAADVSVTGAPVASGLGPSARPVATPPLTAAPQLARPSVVPDNRRKPRYVLGTFWMFWAVVAFFAAFSGGHWWLLIFAAAFVAYAIYLYRGGRFGFWFF